MKAISLTIGLLLATVATACMSDEACSGGAVSMCCYMNECWPTSSINCRGDRLEFFRHLQTLDQNDCKIKDFA